MLRKKLLNIKKCEWAYKKWCEGYTYDQIAFALGCSQGTVYNALRGKKRKRPVLKYEEDR